MYLQSTHNLHVTHTHVNILAQLIQLVICSCTPGSAPPSILFSGILLQETVNDSWLPTLAEDGGRERWFTGAVYYKMLFNSMGGGGGMLLPQQIN